MDQQQSVRAVFGEGNSFSTLSHYDGDDIFMPLVCPLHVDESWVPGWNYDNISYTIGIRITAQ